MKKGRGRKSANCDDFAKIDKRREEKKKQGRKK